MRSGEFLNQLRRTGPAEPTESVVLGRTWFGKDEYAVACAVASALVKLLTHDIQRPGIAGGVVQVARIRSVVVVFVVESAGEAELV